MTAKLSPGVPSSAGGDLVHGTVDATIFPANEENSEESEQRLAHLFTGAQVPGGHVLRVLAG